MIYPKVVNVNGTVVNINTFCNNNGDSLVANQSFNSKISPYTISGTVQYARKNETLAMHLCSDKNVL